MINGAHAFSQYIVAWLTLYTHRPQMSYHAEFDRRWSNGTSLRVIKLLSPSLPPPCLYVLTAILPGGPGLGGTRMSAFWILL